MARRKPTKPLADPARARYVREALDRRDRERERKALLVLRAQPDVADKALARVAEALRLLERTE